MRHRQLSLAAALTATLAASALAEAPTAASADPIYQLPAPAGTELLVAAGNDFSSGRRANEVPRSEPDPVDRSDRRPGPGVVGSSSGRASYERNDRNGGRQRPTLQEGVILQAFPFVPAP